MEQPSLTLSILSIARIVIFYTKDQMVADQCLVEGTLHESENLSGYPARGPEERQGIRLDLLQRQLEANRCGSWLTRSISSS